MGYRESEGRSGGLSADCRGYELRDREGEKIGKVDEVFVDENDRPQYLGVKTGLLGGKLNLIPAELASADEERRIIEVSESKDRVKDAPSLSSNEEVSAEREREVGDYFGLGSGAGAQDETSPGYREGAATGEESGERGGYSDGDERSGSPEDREPWSDSGSDSGSDTRSESSREEPAERGGPSSAAAPSDTRETEERRETGDLRSGGGDRETVRVSVWRQKARAERVTGDDGGEEVRIRKEWVEEEEIVEVEGGRQSR